VALLCYDEMVDSAKPGDRITITGIYKATALRVNPRLKALKVRARAPQRAASKARRAGRMRPHVRTAAAIRRTGRRDFSGAHCVNGWRCKLTQWLEFANG